MFAYGFICGELLAGVTRGLCDFSNSLGFSACLSRTTFSRTSTGNNWTFSSQISQRCATKTKLVSNWVAFLFVLINFIWLWLSLSQSVDFRDTIFVIHWTSVKLKFPVSGLLNFTLLRCFDFGCIIVFVSLHNRRFINVVLSTTVAYRYCLVWSFPRHCFSLSTIVLLSLLNCLTLVVQSIFWLPILNSIQLLSSCQLHHSAHPCVGGKSSSRFVARLKGAFHDFLPFSHCRLVAYCWLVCALCSPRPFDNAPPITYN